MLLSLRDKQSDGNTNNDPWEHLTKFFDTTSMYQLEGITEDQVKLNLFTFSLIGRANDWLLYLPNGVIRTWRESEDKFLERSFTTSKLIEKKTKITQFEQQDIEFVYDAWQRFKLFLQ